jgi:hypothetical protein
MREDKLRKLFIEEYNSSWHCDLADGTESWEKLADVFFTRNDYCNDRSFPSLKWWRLANNIIDLKKLGVYVDGGDIKLTNPKRVCLVGNTSAKIYIDENYRHKINVQYKAKAQVTTDKYGLAIIRRQKGCEVHCRQIGESLILD